MKNLSVINRSNLSYSFFFTGTLRSMQLSKKNTSSLSACCLIFLCSFFGLCKKYHVRNFSTTTQKYEIVQILQEAPHQSNNKHQIECNKHEGFTKLAGFVFIKSNTWVANKKNPSHSNSKMLASIYSIETRRG